jgi:hypothetical protein
LSNLEWITSGFTCQISEFAANLDAVAKTNIQLALRPFDPDSEGTAHLALLKEMF